MKSYDVLIIGGGIIGGCVAYFIKQLAPDTSILVVERDPSYRQSSTVLSNGAIRQQFNLPINVKMSRFTYDFFKNATNHLSIRGEPVDIQFTDCPYLVLAAPDGVERLAAAHERQVTAGARIAYMTAHQLESRVPWIKLEGVGAGCLGLEGEGKLDPLMAVIALRRKALACGIIYLDTEVKAIQQAGGRIRAVITSSGEAIECALAVNAAGAQAARVAAIAGVPLPIESRKRCAFLFQTSTPPAAFTNVVDPTFGKHGIYTGPFGEFFISMTSPEPSQDPNTQNSDVDYYLFEEILRPALAQRVRGFETISLVRAWAGFYEMNCFDQNGLLGPHPDLANFYLACGFSGHGLMHAAAIGRGIAEHMVTGSYQTLDLDCFSYERVMNNRPLDDVQASEHRKVPAGV